MERKSTGEHVLSVAVTICGAFLIAVLIGSVFILGEFDVIVDTLKNTYFFILGGNVDKARSGQNTLSSTAVTGSKREVFLTKMVHIHNEMASMRLSDELKVRKFEIEGQMRMLE